MEKDSSGGASTRINIVSLDDNAVKNNRVKLTEGRMPKNTSEIVLSKQYFSNNDLYLGQELELTINGNKKKYTLVGFTETLVNDDSGGFTFQITVGAITYYDEASLDANSIVDVAIKTKNINKIYETTNNLADRLKLYETQEEKENNIVYNNKLLRYSLVELQDNKPKSHYADDILADEFEGKLNKIVIATISAVAITSIVVIYTSFKIAYSGRVKELGMLTSIGMDKKQKKNMLLKEAIIIGTIGIILGLIIGIILSLFVTKIFNILLSNMTTTSVRTLTEAFLIDSEVSLYMVIPFKTIILTVVLTYIITVISASLPIRKLNKISPIQAIRSTENDDIKRKKLKVPPIIKVLFKQEGELAYKNIRRDKSKYKTIVLSIVISIVLFLAINSIFLNYVSRNIGYDEFSNNKKVSYMIDINRKSDFDTYNTLFNTLEDKNLIIDYYTLKQVLPFNRIFMTVSEDKITENARIISENSIKMYENNNVIPITVKVFEGEKYDEFLKQIGIEKLGMDECILINTVLEDTKYGKNLKMTNFNIGDEIDLNIFTKEQEEKLVHDKNEEENEISEEEKQKIIDEFKERYGIEITMEEEKQEEAEITYENDSENLKIVEVVDSNIKDTPFYAPSDKLQSELCYLWISEETAEKWESEYVNENSSDSIYFASYISTDKPEEISKEIAKLREETLSKGESFWIAEDNSYKYKNDSAYESLIKKLGVYLFLGMIATLSCVNIFVTISSSISLRKKDIAELKSIGMSDKQINKMLFLEGLFFGLDAIIYGILIGIVVLYLIYIFIIDVDYNIKPFKLPYIDFAICIIVAYAVIFLSIFYTKKNIQNQNIIDEIKDENI